MKKLLIICLIMSGLPVLADEQKIQTEQTIQNENTYLGANFQKAPAEPNGKQLIVNHKSFLILNIIVNGKIKPNNTPEK